MKVSDFKLLSTLPEEFDYELFFHSESSIWVIGKSGQSVVSFLLKDSKFLPINFGKERTNNAPVNEK